jgi:hypothetical protein
LNETSIGSDNIFPHERYRREVLYYIMAICLSWSLLRLREDQMTDEDHDRHYEQQVDTFERLVDQLNIVLQQYGKHD